MIFIHKHRLVNILIGDTPICQSFSSLSLLLFLDADAAASPGTPPPESSVVVDVVVGIASV